MVHKPDVVVVLGDSSVAGIVEGVVGSSTTVVDVSVLLVEDISLTLAGDCVLVVAGVVVVGHGLPHVGLV